LLLFFKKEALALPSGTPMLTLNHIINQAKHRTQLTEFGPDQFIEPLNVLINSINTEAHLTEAGEAAQTERLINALSNRLRKQHLLRTHLEIHAETVSVAVVITSLPRTGSTMLQRLLGASPLLTATHWWETIFPLPLEGETRFEHHLRLQHARALIAMIMGAAENIETMHPMDPLAHDEDLMIVEQSFVSTMPEAMMYVPSYGAYVLSADDSWVYEELTDYLKILQWQSPARAGRKWILKSPNHMQHVPRILAQFPEALMVMTHRDIVQVMGSWFSLAESLRRADSSADVTRENVAHWIHRWRTGLQTTQRARATAPDRFVDVAYTDLLAEPLSAATTIHTRAGLPFDAATRNALQAWLAANPRDARPSHRYALADYGLDEATLRETFAPVF
jgi:hypothetical protein